MRCILSSISSPPLLSVTPSRAFRRVAIPPSSDRHTARTFPRGLFIVFGIFAAKTDTPQPPARNLAAARRCGCLFGLGLPRSTRSPFARPNMDGLPARELAPRTSPTVRGLALPQPFYAVIISNLERKCQRFYIKFRKYFRKI